MSPTVMFEVHFFANGILDLDRLTTSAKPVFTGRFRQDNGG